MSNEENKFIFCDPEEDGDPTLEDENLVIFFGDREYMIGKGGALTRVVDDEQLYGEIVKILKKIQGDNNEKSI